MINYTQHSPNIPFNIECLTYRVLKVNELELYSPNDLNAKGDRTLATRLYSNALCVQEKRICAKEKRIHLFCFGKLKMLALLFFQRF